jgi:hypothetical protein
MTALISILFALILVMAFFLYKMYRKISALEDEVTNMRFIRVKENPDGSYTLTSQDGKPIFEL